MLSIRYIFWGRRVASSRRSVWTCCYVFVSVPPKLIQIAILHHLGTSFPFLLVPIRNEMPRLSFIFEASSSRDLTVRNGGEKMSTALRRIWRFLGLGTTRSYCIVLHVFGFTCFALIRTMNSQHATACDTRTWWYVALCHEKINSMNFAILGQSDKRGTGMGVTGPWHSMTKNQQNSSRELIRVQRGEVPEDLGGLSSSDSQDLAID